jgi:hypothetical protein
MNVAQQGKECKGIVALGNAKDAKKGDRDTESHIARN